MKNIPIFILIVVLFACSQNKIDSDYTRYVDPMIGTDGTGHMVPGPNMPFGMVQLSPDTYNNSCCNGYKYKHSTILGFSHTHLHGTGCGDYGDILLMPTVGNVNIHPGTEDDPDSGYRSRFTHKNETASIGYYSVDLEDYNITAELTSTARVGFHKYNFPTDKNSHIILDLKHSVSNESTLSDCYIKIVSDTEIEGFRHSRGWASDQHLYFVIKFSKPFKKSTLFENDKMIDGSEFIEASEVKAVFDFETIDNEPVMIKVALSAVNTDGARKNLHKELPGWNFENTVKNAKKVWNKEFEKIRINGKNEDQKTIFYTAYYHTLLTPNLFMDVDGKYRGMDHQIYETDGFDYYTVFSLWDTYRALHPLLTIINPDKNIDFCKTMLKQYQHSGLLPVWELAGSETNCMIGYHSVPVLTDMYLKGFDDFDLNLALEAMITSASQNTSGINYYRNYEFIPREMENNSVSKVLEYAYDDWCIAQFAKKLGRDDVYKEYIIRSQYYKNQFDPSTGLMRGRHKDGTWKEPFNDLQISLLGSGDFTEANAWHYSFYVPQNIPEHIKMIGGDDEYNKLLDEFFSKKPKGKGDFAGQPGFGLYAHGNEPSHHVPYLYNFSGQPWKTQKFVRKVMDELYTSKPDGICGNDDCGQMSAWYVFSALGFYPVTPGQDMYIIGTPQFEETVMKLPNDKTLKILANNISDKNLYIQSIKMNGNNYPKTYFTFSDLSKGGEIIFEMGSTPNKNFGVAKTDRPFAIEIEENHQLQPLGTKKLFPPSLSTTKRIFTKSMEIKLDCISPDVEIFYTLDGSEPDKNSLKYEQEIILNRTTTLKAIAHKNGYKNSSISVNKFFKSTIQYDNPKTQLIYKTTNDGVDYFGKMVDGKYSTNKYSGGGEGGLIDGNVGTSIYTDGYWQGFEAKDMEVVLDLGKEVEISRITTNFLKKLDVWIFFPTQIEYSISQDDKTYKSIGSFHTDVNDKKNKDGINIYTKEFQKTNVRYVKVFAKNPGICPAWHHGGGGRPWIFVDEIIVE